MLLNELVEAQADLAVSGAVSDKAAVEDSDIERMMDIADLLWEAEHGAPPLADDPTALMLGLVPDPGVAVDPRALNRLRKNAGLTVSQLAERLVSRGWDVTGPQIFRWQTQGAFDLSPALLQAIAEELGSTTDGILSTPTVDARPKWLTDVTTSPAFEQLVQRWAQLKGIPTQLATTALESRMLATVHRGGRPEVAQLLQSLDAFISSLENGGEEAP